MELLLMVLILLMLIGISNVIHRFLPFIPVPLIQITLGVTAAFMPKLHHVPLNPELFLVLFIAPLLFNDGMVIPRNELWNLRKSILLMALGLVFFTVLIAGPFIHWLIPAIPLSAAFALAAILSPTDAVAVGSLSGRVKLPASMMRLLEGEALMNDASGLVAFNFAIAATVTGQFSLSKAVGSFVIIATGGLVIGTLLGFAVIWLRVFLRRLGIEDVTLHMLIIILTPFVIYLIAEECHVSGILSVVAAGIVHSIERDRMELASVRLRIVSDSTWSVILFSLNGLVFLLLGLEIPGVITTIWEDPSYRNGQVIGYILLITAVLMLIRFLWVLATDRQFHSALLTTLSGVRGALTLAASFSIPMLLADGSLFPQRSLILFISAGVILLTLVTASVVLPMLTCTSEEDVKRNKNSAELERRARIRVIEAGLHAIREETDDENRAEAVKLISEYNRLLQMTRLQGRLDYGSSWKTAVKLRLEGLRAEREVVERWQKEEKISPQLAAHFQSSLSQVELILTNRLKIKLLLYLTWTALKSRRHRMQLQSDPSWGAVKAMKLEAVHAAIERMEQLETEDNRDILRSILADYRNMAAQLEHGITAQPSGLLKKSVRRDLELKAFQAERNEIQSMYENGDIDRNLAGSLRIHINYREASVMEAQTVQSE